MNSDSYLFWRVAELGRRAVVTCSPDDGILSVAALMRERRVSGVVVSVDDEPAGMITDRDFRNRLDDIARTGGKLRASDLMSSPVTTIGEADYLFEAIYRMSRHRIHRLVVTGPEGKIAGIITDADLIKVQLTTPVYLGRDIESAQTIDDLGRIHKRVVDVVSHATLAGAKTGDTVRLISHLHDAITQRTVAILLQELGDPLAGRFAFLALGSEGRGEQTLKTDQDNAIVYADDLSAEELAHLEAFSERLIEALVQIGVPRCPGGIMANQPKWRRSLTEWTRAVERWVSSPSPDNLLEFGSFCDLRTIYGPPEYERQIKEAVLAAIKHHTFFLASLAKNILRFPPALGMFGRLKPERTGENKGKIDLKKTGIFAITEGIALLAMAAGAMDGGTHQKIAVLKEKNVLPAQELDRIAEAFEFLSFLRLQHQLALVKEGLPPDNFIDPKQLSAAHVARLKETYSTVALLQQFLREQYKLDLLGQ